MKTNRTLFFVLIANLAALSYVLQYFRIPLPFLFPGFLEIHFSNVPAIIGGFALGPIAGGLIVVLKFFMQILFVPSYTLYVGEIVDLILGVSTVVVSALVYKRMRSKKGALYASLLGILTWVVVAVIANYAFVVDFYARLLDSPEQNGLDTLIQWMSIIPGINRTNYMARYIFLAVIPFNFLISTLVYGITFLVYKRVSSFITYLNERFSKDTE